MKRIMLKLVTLVACASTIAYGQEAPYGVLEVPLNQINTILVKSMEDSLKRLDQGKYNQVYGQDKWGEYPMGKLNGTYPYKKLYEEYVLNIDNPLEVMMTRKQYGYAIPFSNGSSLEKNKVENKVNQNRDDYNPSRPNIIGSNPDFSQAGLLNPANTRFRFAPSTNNSFKVLTETYLPLFDITTVPINDTRKMLIEVPVYSGNRCVLRLFGHCFKYSGEVKTTQKLMGTITTIIPPITYKLERIKLGLQIRFSLSDDLKLNAEVIATTAEVLGALNKLPTTEVFYDFRGNLPNMSIKGSSVDFASFQQQFDARIKQEISLQVAQLSMLINESLKSNNIDYKESISKFCGSINLPKNVANKCAQFANLPRGKGIHLNGKMSKIGCWTDSPNNALYSTLTQTRSTDSAISSSFRYDDQAWFRNVSDDTSSCKVGFKVTAPRHKCNDALIKYVPYVLNQANMTDRSKMLPLSKVASEIILGCL